MSGVSAFAERLSTALTIFIGRQPGVVLAQLVTAWILTRFIHGQPFWRVFWFLWLSDAAFTALEWTARAWLAARSKGSGAVIGR